MKNDWKKEYPLGALLLKGLTTVAEIFVYSLVIFFAWNFVMPKLGIVTLVNYWYAVALFLLSRFLLNDHILSPDPIIMHCDCFEDEGTPMVVEDKK